MTHYDLETSPDLRAWCPEMVSMLSRVANLRVRSTGTLGGNLCFADPHSDPATFLVAAGATLVCQAGGDTRRVPAGQFVTGPYQTVLEPGELLVAVEVPFTAPGTGMAHVRMKLHERPAVTVAAWVRLEGGVVSDARLAVGSVGWVPLSVDVAGMLGGACRMTSVPVRPAAPLPRRKRAIPSRTGRDRPSTSGTSLAYMPAAR